MAEFFVSHPIREYIQYITLLFFRQCFRGNFQSFLSKFPAVSAVASGAVNWYTFDTDQPCARPPYTILSFAAQTARQETPPGCDARRCTDSASYPRHATRYFFKETVMTPADIVIVILTVLVLAAAVAVPVLRKRKGKSSCGCGCSGCPHSGSCANQQEEKPKQP